MIHKVSQISALVFVFSLMVTSLSAQDIEYDDMYFTKKDLAAIQDLEKERMERIMEKRAREREQNFVGPTSNISTGVNSMSSVRYRPVDCPTCTDVYRYNFNDSWANGFNRFNNRWGLSLGMGGAVSGMWNSWNMGFGPYNNFSAWRFSHWAFNPFYAWMPSSYMSGPGWMAFNGSGWGYNPYCNVWNDRGVRNTTVYRGGRYNRSSASRAYTGVGRTTDYTGNRNGRRSNNNGTGIDNNGQRDVNPFYNPRTRSRDNGNSGSGNNSGTYNRRGRTSSGNSGGTSVGGGRSGGGGNSSGGSSGGRRRGR